MLFSLIAALSLPAEEVDLESLLKKADAGDPNAQLAIGSYYAKGEHSLKADGQMALKYLNAAANQGLPSAMTFLGVIYAEGKIVPRDMKSAVHWRERGAEKGTPNDKWVLGNAYFFGFMMPKDPARALYWFEKAAEENDPNSIAKLVEIYEKIGDAKKLADIKKKFSNLEVLAAEKGNVAAMTAIAKKYMTGKDGLPRDRIKGIYWFRQASDKGDPEATEKLAQMYARGKFLSQNTEKAQELFLKLAALDNAYCFKISKFYAEGESTFPRDEEKALEWFERGAASSDATTKLYVAWRFWKGDDTIKPNPDKAVYWCEQCLPKDGGVDRKKDKTELAALKMLKDIMQGKPAPDSLKDILDTGPVM